MKSVFIPAAAGIIFMGLVTFSKPAEARIDPETCRELYEDCDAGDQTACEDPTYRVCMRQWGPHLPVRLPPPPPPLRLPPPPPPPPPELE